MNDWLGFYIPERGSSEGRAKDFFFSFGFKAALTIISSEWPTRFQIKKGWIHESVIKINPLVWSCKLENCWLINSRKSREWMRLPKELAQRRGRGPNKLSPKDLLLIQEKTKKYPQRYEKSQNNMVPQKSEKYS